MNPENINAENPEITLNALIIMLRPIVARVLTVASSWVKPFLSSMLKHHINCIVKSTPTPIIMDDKSAVAASSAMPVIPMNPKRIRIEATNGIEPVNPPLIDLKIIASSIRTVITAKSNEETCPLIMDPAKSAIIIA